jgi:hypothetical protein
MQFEIFDAEEHIVYHMCTSPEVEENFDESLRLLSAG